MSSTPTGPFIVTGDDFEGSSLCSEYGFAEKVVEGMFIVVNSITIKIHSKAFHASFELWQLQGYSVNPNWQQSDLRLTRITDPQRGEVKGPRMLPVLTCSEGWPSCYPSALGQLGCCLNSHTVTVGSLPASCWNRMAESWLAFRAFSELF